ncbi:MAG TPA: hypothetical protein VI488_16365 [Candidatus Angelobacter sp.]
MTATANDLAEIGEFWRVARRLHTIYAELDRTFELGMPPCVDLEMNVERSDPETLQRIRQWFQNADGLVHVWQLRQLLQSTNLQTEENLRYLILRHLDKERKAETDKEKIDFLLVQYFAHCAPPGLIDHHITLEGVARVLEPALREVPAKFPDWTARLDEKLGKMNDCNSLEELQESGSLVEAREMKTAAGERYFESAALVAFTRFNFLARRAFFRAMHLDLHAIRASVNELEKLGFSSLDCREAGLSENESLEQLRHVVHQWKTPFRAPYSAGGESFQQLISLRQSLEWKLKNAQAAAPGGAPSNPSKAAPVDRSRASEKAPATKAAPSAASAASAATVPKPPAAPAPPVLKATAVAPPAAAAVPTAGSASLSPAPPRLVTAEPTPDAPRSVEEEDDYLQRCVTDIADQLAAVPPKNTPSVSTIHLGGCKLLIATWEADAFKSNAEPLQALQRAVAARTILHVCMERHKKNEATDLDAALEIAQRQAEEMKTHVIRAKEASNIDAAVNLAATAKRLMALVEESQKLRA